MKKFIFVFIVLFIFSLVFKTPKTQALTCILILESYYASYEDGNFIVGFKVEREKVTGIDYDTHESCGYFKNTILEVSNKNEVDSLFKKALQINSTYPHDMVLDNGVYELSYEISKIDDNPNNLSLIKEQIIQGEIENRKEIARQKSKSFYREIFFDIDYFLILITLIINSYIFIKNMNKLKFLGKALIKNILLQIFLTFFFFLIYIILLFVASRINIEKMSQSQIEIFGNSLNFFVIEHDIFSIMLILTPLIIIIEIFYYIFLKIKRRNNADIEIKTTTSFPNPDKQN